MSKYICIYIYNKCIYSIYICESFVYTYTYLIVFVSMSMCMFIVCIICFSVHHVKMGCTCKGDRFHTVSLATDYFGRVWQHCSVKTTVHDPEYLPRALPTAEERYKINTKTMNVTWFQVMFLFPTAQQTQPNFWTNSWDTFKGFDPCRRL